MKEQHEQILNYIKSYISENGYAPTVREITIGCGWKSTSTAWCHMEAMKEKGLIIQEEFSQPRSIKIPGFNCNSDGKMYKIGSSDNKNQENGTLFDKNVPLFVLHGYWFMPDDDGVNVYGVSAELEKMEELMLQTGEQMVEDAIDSELEVILDDIKTSQTKYEAENSDGYYVRLYITEHEVI